MTRSLSVLLMVLACVLCLPAPGAAQGIKIERVQVTDPFVELRTGPGRGFPVFFVAAKG